jgi:hypothetical protein
MRHHRTAHRIRHGNLLKERCDEVLADAGQPVDPGFHKAHCIEPRGVVGPADEKTVYGPILDRLSRFPPKPVDLSERVVGDPGIGLPSFPEALTVCALVIIELVEDEKRCAAESRTSRPQEVRKSDPVRRGTSSPGFHGHPGKGRAKLRYKP